MKHYKAQWGIFLIVMSSLQTALCLGLAFAAFRHGGTLSWGGLLLLAVAVGCAFFVIRGYTITSGAILVHCLLWATRLPLAGLQSARFEPLPMWPGLRIGNDGFFSCTGWCYSRGLGSYRVFVTNHRQGVVLRYPNRTVAVSPAAPEEFVHELAIPSHPA